MNKIASLLVILLLALPAAAWGQCTTWTPALVMGKVNANGTWTCALTNQLANTHAVALAAGGAWGGTSIIIRAYHRDTSTEDLKTCTADCSHTGEGFPEKIQLIVTGYAGVPIAPSEASQNLLAHFERPASVAARAEGTALAHHSRHQHGGLDEGSVAGLSGVLADAQTSAAHHASHEPNGGDPMVVDAVGGTGSLRTLGAGGQQACSGTDARLSDARAPLTHAGTHQHGGGDEVATATPAANAIPKAGAGGQLDPGWTSAGTHPAPDIIWHWDAGGSGAFSITSTSWSTLVITAFKGAAIKPSEIVTAGHTFTVRYAGSYGSGADGTICGACLYYVAADGLTMTQIASSVITGSTWGHGATPPVKLREAVLTMSEIPSDAVALIVAIRADSGYTFRLWSAEIIRQ